MWIFTDSLSLTVCLSLSVWVCLSLFSSRYISLSLLADVTTTIRDGSEFVACIGYDAEE